MTDDQTPPTDTTTPPQEDTTTPPQEDTTMQAAKLGDDFDTALLGATICGRFAYSLTQLTAIAMQKMPLTREQAQQYIGHQVIAVTRAHGIASPVFVDDELVHGIATPTEEDVKILVPGQNHGGVKGFLAPGELGRGAR